MKKKLFLAAIAIGMLASCADNEYVGEVSPNPNAGGDNQAIVFSSGTKALTRADHEGAKAAGLLNNEFVFAGTKGLPTGDPAVISNFVFDQYTAKYVSNTANTTESNSSNWEYVGLQPAVTTSLSGNDKTQTIKYWDYATKQYDFAAYSTYNKTIITSGTPTTGQILATAIDKTTKSYSLTGSAEDLKAAYISDLVTAYNWDGVSDYGQVVTFKFRSLATKIRMAFYETVPGYSVKNIQFYHSSADNETATSTPTLFTSTAVLPSGSGTMTVTFPTTGFDKRPGGSNADTDYNKAHVSFTQANESTAASTLTFGDLTYVGAEKNEGTAGDPATGWIGRSSNQASYAGGKQVHSDPNDDQSVMIENYYTILPSGAGNNLQLRIDYTLVSTDGSKEEINVKNATAVIPAELAQWEPNYAYTYIFKISDMTNGSTGVDGSNNVITGLTPITLNAVVVDSEDGIQETITTVSKPSITTYTKGVVVTANDEYVTGNIIYVIVNNGISNEELTVGTNANLYTVTLTASTDTGDSPAASPSQPISEESVENALIYGTKDDDSNPTTWTVKDANQWKLVVKKVASGFEATNAIAAADSPTGNEISIGTNKVAKFTAGAAGTVYVFEFKKDAVAAQSAEYYSEEEISNAQEGDPAYGKTTSDIKTPAVEASDAQSQYKIIKIKQ